MASSSASDLPFDILFTYANPRDLPRLSLVCREFRSLARDDGVCRQAVARFLGLDAIGGPAPRSVRFWHAAQRSSPSSLSQAATPLVTLHRLAPGDSLCSLALRHGCSAADLRRLNGLGSERAHTCHSHLAVPAAAAGAAAAGQRRLAAVRFLGAARREVLLLLPAGDQGDAGEDEDDEQVGVVGEGEEQQQHGPRRRRPSVAAGAAEEEETTAATRQHQQHQQQQRRQRPPTTMTNAATTTSFTALLRRKLREYVGRAARVDPGAASFYLDEAGGDVATALRSAREDEEWARRAARTSVRPNARARSAPLRAFMEGDGFVVVGGG